MNIQELIAQFKLGGHKTHFSHKDVLFILEQIDVHSRGSEVVKVIYQDVENGDKIIFEETIQKTDLPQTGNAFIMRGQHYRIGTIWHDKDKGIIEVDLTDL